MSIMAFMSLHSSLRISSKPGNFPQKLPLVKGLSLHSFIVTSQNTQERSEKNQNPSQPSTFKHKEGTEFCQKGNPVTNTAIVDHKRSVLTKYNSQFHLTPPSSLLSPNQLCCFISSLIPSLQRHELIPDSINLNCIIPSNSVSNS